MKMIEQHDVTRTHSCKPGYLNLSIVSLQMYNSTIFEQKLNDVPDHNNQNVFETSFASVFCLQLSTHWSCMAELETKILRSELLTNTDITWTISVTILLIVVLLLKFSVVRFVCV